MDDYTVAAEAAARAHAEAVVSNNVGAVVLGMTPDAFAKAMDIGNTTWGYLGFELAKRASEDDAYVFDITFSTDQGTLTLRNKFRYVDSGWKVVDLERID